MAAFAFGEEEINDDGGGGGGGKENMGLWLKPHVVRTTGSDSMSAMVAMAAMAAFGRSTIFSTVVGILQFGVWYSCMLYSDFASTSDFVFFEASILALIRTFECWLTTLGPHCRHCQHPIRKGKGKMRLRES